MSLYDKMCVKILVRVCKSWEESWEEGEQVCGEQEQRQGEDPLPRGRTCEGRGQSGNSITTSLG